VDVVTSILMLGLSVFGSVIAEEGWQSVKRRLVILMRGKRIAISRRDADLHGECVRRCGRPYERRAWFSTTTRRARTYRG
jgi:hypothetical protein